MSGTLVCLTAQEDLTKRYVKTFAGVNEIIFTDKATALRLNRAGSMSLRIAGIMRDEAANGKAPVYFGSTQAQSATGAPLPGEPVFDQYSGPNGAKRPAAPVYLNKKDANGIWRVLPPRVRVAAGYAINIAMVFQNRARAEVVVADTELQVIDKVFDPSVPLFAAFVASLPVANVVEEVAPVEVAPDLTNLQPMTREEYNSIPAALAQRKNQTDPVFRKRLNLMLKEESDRRDQRMREQQEVNDNA